MTFLQNHGDNFPQAFQLARVIDWIRELRVGGPGFQVDLVAHSEGSLAARLYLTRAWSLGGPCFRGDAQMLAALVVQGFPFGPGSTREGTELPPRRNAIRGALWWGGRSETLAWISRALR